MTTLEAARKHMEDLNVAQRRRGKRRGRSTATWPRASDALGVHPSQIPEAIAVAKKHGISVDFTRDGRAILSSQQNEREYAELYGIKQNNGGYGDTVDPRKTLWGREGEDVSRDLD